MPTYRYALIQYVPNSARDERLNVGVVVAGIETTFFGSRMVSPPEAGRLRRLGYHESFDFLNDLAAELGRSGAEEDQLPGTSGGVWTAELLDRAAREWANTIQFAPLRAVVAEEPSDLLDRLFGQLVADPRQPGHRARDRRWIRRTAVDTLRRNVPSSFNFAAHVREDAQVSGEVEAHNFDLELVNGQPLQLVQALAVEGGGARAEHVDRMAWSIDDVRKRDHVTPIGVLAIGEETILARAEHVCSGLGADFVREAAMEDWLSVAATRLLEAVDDA